MDFFRGLFFFNRKTCTKKTNKKMNERYFTKDEKNFMGSAIKIAEKGRGHTSPNPLVGAVIVKDGIIISKGYHMIAGGPHAEINAINACKDKNALKSAKMFVTLEPCSVYGKTPPCTDEIIKHGFSEVVIGAVDPNPKINGRGIEALKGAGITVSSGLFANIISEQNEVFFKNMRTHIPFVTLKSASSLDGKTAAKNGQSKWVTSERSRQLVQKIRKENDCVLTGINTVVADDPLLYPHKGPGGKVDIFSGKKFFRIILDSSLRIGMTSNIVKTAAIAKTLIFISAEKKQDMEKIRQLEAHDIDIIKVPENKNNPGGKRGLDILAVLRALYGDYSVTSVLLESGPTLATEFLKRGLIDKFMFFIAPVLIGGDSDFGIFSRLDILSVDSSIRLRLRSVKRTDRDIFITAYPLKGND